MTRRIPHTTPIPLPRVARWLGFAGLLPQMLLAAVAHRQAPLSVTAIGLALAYAALILSFLGGTWWGLAAHSSRPVSPWLWLAAIAPSLIAFAAIGAFLTGYSPRPMLMLVAGSLFAALGIDYRLQECALCPPGWLRLRFPLSIGLGGLTMLIAMTST